LKSQTPAIRVTRLITPSANLSRKTRSSALPNEKSGEGPITCLWQKLVVRLLVGVTGGVQRLSRPNAMRFGTWLGGVAYHIAGKQRRYADRNLRLASPSLRSFPGPCLNTAEEREQFTRSVFAHFGRCLIDFLRAPRLTKTGLDSLVNNQGEAEGWQHVQNALAKGKGVIFLSAHLGNWELLGRWLAAQGVPLTVVAREPKDATFAAYLTGMREKAGFTVLNKGESARELLRVLRRGEAIFLMPDQNSGDVFIPFFDILAGTVAGPASLALHTGASLIPAYCVSREDTNGDTCYQTLFLPPLKTENTGNKDEDVRRIMTEANRVLEEVIRRYPTQWLWLHNRWKSAFEEKNREHWTPDNDFPAALSRWENMPSQEVTTSEPQAENDFGAWGSVFTPFTEAWDERKEPKKKKSG
jgi:KDO2-lipid IV(A) lauroyltransferase